MLPKLRTLILFLIFLSAPSLPTSAGPVISEREPLDQEPKPTAISNSEQQHGSAILVGRNLVQVIVSPDGLGDYPTIQEAIDAVQSGAEILLRDGTFQGDGNRDLDLLGKELKIRRHSRGPGHCTIDCQGSEFNWHRAITLETGNGPETLLEGITFRNGFYNYGGAILILGGASPVVSDCVFISNQTLEYGGAVEIIDGSSPTFQGCRFQGNSSQSGGAIDVYGGSTPNINDCLFISNSAVQGGGIHSENANPLVTGSTFFANKGGRHCMKPLYQSSLPQHAHQIVVGRADRDFRTHAAGIFAYAGSSVVLENTILAFSKSGTATACQDNSSVSLVCCDVFGNQGGDYVDCISGMEGLDGNISADPLFCDPSNGDLSLFSHSPCTADNNSCLQLIGAMDAGCSMGMLFVRGDTNADGVIDISDPLYSLFYQYAGGPPPSCLDAADLDDSGVIDISDPIFSLMYQFAGGPPPPPPFPACGLDPTEDFLDCLDFFPCDQPMAKLTEFVTPMPSSGFVRLGDAHKRDGELLEVSIGIMTGGDVFGFEILLSYDPDDCEFLCLSQEDQDAFGFLAAHGENGQIRIGGVSDLKLVSPMHVGWTALGRIALRTSAHDAIGGQPLRAESCVMVRSDGSPLSMDWVASAGKGIGSEPGAVPLSLVVPSPFRPGMSIRCTSLGVQSGVVAIYDIQGRCLRTLHDGPIYESGLVLNWNGESSKGKPLQSGVYFIKAQFGGEAVSRKVLLFH